MFRRSDVRSSFHVFLGGLMLITVTGRSVSMPVDYLRDGETLPVASRVDRTEKTAGQQIMPI